jgi:large subunit ribosomal protein L17
MKKKKAGRKLSRERNQRKALLKSLASALFIEEKIKTTEAKAKEVSRFSQKCITKARKGDIAARRHLARFFSEKVVKKLVDDIGKRYQTRPGGYVRLVKLNPRKSDGAKMAILELV